MIPGNIVFVSYRKEWGMFIVNKIINRNIVLLTNQNKKLWIKIDLIKKQI